MTKARRSLRLATVMGVVALVAALLAAPSMLTAADHLDAPLVALDGRTDINDVYVFTSPENPAHTVLIMTVNPAAGVLSDTTFSNRARYEFLIDNDGDAVEDTTYRITFSRPRDGTQRVSLRTEGDGTNLRARGLTGKEIAVRGGAMTADIFEDPFFFDLNGFNDGLNFTGDDFFAGLNVSAIVLEVPTSALGDSGDLVGVWARTSERGVQVDRMGRPAINTVLIPSANKDAFNAGEPADDQANFRTDVVATITALSGDSAYAEALADVLLPDLNTFTLGDTTGFLNGRQLADDVIDAELALLSKGAVTTDLVDMNDADFQNVFPYLAPAN